MKLSIQLLIDSVVTGVSIFILLKIGAIPIAAVIGGVVFSVLVDGVCGFVAGFWAGWKKSGGDRHDET